MNVKIENHTNLKVTLNPSEDGKFAILIVEPNSTQHNNLGNVPRGKCIKIGKREFIVLDHSADTTALIAKNAICDMEFDSDSADYSVSKVRKYLNDHFYRELVSSVGKDTVITHSVDLMADDGTGKGKICRDNVSLLTTDRYRRYREFLPATGKWWWVATRASYGEGYARRVCCVVDGGALNWSGCDYCGGVRPFCILRSSFSDFEEV